MRPQVDDLADLSLISKVRAWLRRLAGGSADDSFIARGMAWVAMFVLVGKLAGATKEMVVAYRFGVGPTVDAFNFVFAISNWPAGLWHSVLMVVFVPLAVRARRDDSSGLAVFRSELFGSSLMLSGVVAVSTWTVLGILLGTQASGLSTKTAMIAASVTPVLALGGAWSVLACLLAVWSLASGSHRNTLLEGVPALVIALALLVLPSGAWTLAWAVVGGVVLQTACLAIPLSRIGDIQAPRFTWRSPYWSAFVRGFSVLLLSQALLSAVNVADQFFAARIGEGAIAKMGYANRLIALILGLGATAIGRATLPVFSRSVDMPLESVRRCVHRWMVIVLAAGVAGCALAHLLAPWAVALLFQRGAFGADDAQAVVQLFRAGLWQAPFQFACLVSVSLLSSRSHYVLVLLSSFLGLIVKIGSNLALVPLFGVAGLMGGWVIVHAFNAAFFAVVIRQLR